MLLKVGMCYAIDPKQQNQQQRPKHQAVRLAPELAAAAEGRPQQALSVTLAPLLQGDVE